jgi:Tfp pilus assembly protein FimT
MQRTNVSSASRRRQSGFTVLELTISLFITAEVILAGLALFDFHNKLARVTTQVSDMQQSLRVAQYDMVRLGREAGRGGFPGTTMRGAWGAIAVRNNVGGAVSDQIAIGFPSSPKAVDGTDILTLRGVLSSSVFQLNPVGGGFTFAGGTSPATATTGTVVVCSTTPSGLPQDLSLLVGAIAAGKPEALILVSPLNESVYAIVELNTANSDATNLQASCPGAVAPNGVKLAFNITAGTYASQFQVLSATTSTAGLPPLLTSVAWLGILEEYRYYVRQDFVVPGNSATDPAPHLSRARMYPGTETPYYNDSTYLQSDIADNVLDLQVALGVDTDGDGLISEATPPGNTDEWLGNATGDTLTATPGMTLRELRISTLAKTGSLDLQYQAPLLTNIEDHVYKPTDFANTAAGRRYRRRLLQTVVGLRNL